MPGLVADVATVVDGTLPYPSSCANIVQKLRGNSSEFAKDLAEALEGLQDSVDDAHAALRQNPPEIHKLVVTDQDGNIVGQIGELPTEDGSVVYGGHFIELYVGDAVGNRDPLDAPFYADVNGHVFIGKNGWLDVLDPYGGDAAWLGTQFDVLDVTNAVANGTLIRLTVTAHTLATGDSVRVLDVGGVPNARGYFTVTVINANTIDLQNSVFDGTYTSGGTVDRLLHITNATDDGSGLIQIEIVDHGYESGDTVHIEAAGGVPNATGQWIIDVVDADNFILLDSTWGGGYTSGGIALRYFAGGLFQTIAIGPSFDDYVIRAFADGSLVIRNATITLESATGIITLDPTLPSIIARSYVNDTQVRIELGSLFVESIATPGVFTGWAMFPQTLTLDNVASTEVFNIRVVSEDPRMSMTNLSNITTVDIDGGIGTISVLGQVLAAASIIAGGYLDGFQLRIQSVVTIDQLRNGDLLSLTLDSPLTIANGGTGAITDADARTNLDVYSKGEVDAIIAALTTSSAGSHTHGGAVPADGSHTHTIT